MVCSKRFPVSLVLASFFLVIMATESEVPQMMVGSPGETKAATPEVQEYVDQVKEEVEKKTSKNFGEFLAISFKTQVVAGTNYFVKVRVGPNEFIHLRIYKPLPFQGDKVELASFRENMTEESNIDYF